MLCDVIARTALSPAELPIGVVTAFFGAPFFAIALRSMRGGAVNAIRRHGVTVTLGGRAVVREVDLDVPGGQWVGLIGPNGAGKTTLLRALAGLVPYDGDDRGARHRRRTSSAGATGRAPSRSSRRSP